MTGDSVELFWVKHDATSAKQNALKTPYRFVEDHRLWIWLGEEDHSHAAFVGSHIGPLLNLTQLETLLSELPTHSKEQAEEKLVRYLLSTLESPLTEFEDAPSTLWEQSPEERGGLPSGSFSWKILLITLLLLTPWVIALAWIRAHPIVRVSSIRIEKLTIGNYLKFITGKMI